MTPRNLTLSHSTLQCTFPSFSAKSVHPSVNLPPDELLYGSFATEVKRLLGEKHMVEFDDLRSHCVESLDHTRSRRVGGEPFGERGGRRREVETGTIVRVGGIKP